MIFNLLNTVGDVLTSGFFWEKPLTPQLKQKIKLKLEELLSTIDTIDPDNYQWQTTNAQKQLVVDYYNNQFHLMMFQRPWILLTYREKMLVDSIHSYFMYSLSIDYTEAYNLVDNRLEIFDEEF